VRYRWNSEEWAEAKRESTLTRPGRPGRACWVDSDGPCGENDVEETASAGSGDGSAGLGRRLAGDDAGRLDTRCDPEETRVEVGPEIRLADWPWET
jgi:hypothetical protein